MVSSKKAERPSQKGKEGQKERKRRVLWWASRTAAAGIHKSKQNNLKNKLFINNERGLRMANIAFN